MVHDGKVILLGVSAAFLVAWILEFLTFPFFLVPGFLLDRSLQVLFTFLWMVFQLGFFGVCSILLWIGVGWVRYVFGFYLMVAGLTCVVISIAQDAWGGPQLALGAVYLVSATMLVVSLGVTRYMESRRSAGVPWLTVGLAIAGFMFVFMAVAALQLFQVWMVVQTNRQETAFASDIFQRFAPALDSSVIHQVADAKLKQDMVEVDFAGQCKEMKESLSDYKGWDDMEPASLSTLVLAPPNGSELLFNGKANYARGGLVLYLQLDVSQRPWKVTQISFTRTNG